MSETPAAYAVFAETGNCRIWWSHPISEHAVEYARRNSLEVVPLYRNPVSTDFAGLLARVAEGEAAKEVLFWWAEQLSTAAPEKLPEVVRDGYSRIVNLANVLKKG